MTRGQRRLHAAIGAGGGERNLTQRKADGLGAPASSPSNTRMPWEIDIETKDSPN